MFWPSTRPKMPSKVMHRKEVTHSNGSYERKSRWRKLADEMVRGKKFPWYTHRLIHRKRVTCELHESYFRLMTIKHVIEWVLNYYITQSRQKSRQLSSSGNCSRIGDGDRRGRVIPKTQKMILDAALLNPQHYKVRIKGKVEQSWEWSSTLPYTLV